MKKILCLIIAIVLMLTCVGCGDIQMESVHDQKPAEMNSSMFVLIEENVLFYNIVYHKETKVMYAVSTGSYNCGTFTVMLDADGKPLLWEE